MSLVRRGITRGGSPWTGTFLANMWLAAAWSLVFLLRGEQADWSLWGRATLIAFTFVAGQVFTYFAFQFGDVSVATPVFGVKVVIVAIVLAFLAGEQIGGHIWIGAVLAAAGVGCIQAGGSADRRQARSSWRTFLTIVLALLAACSLTLFDVGLQIWGQQQGAQAFLPPMFICTGALSLLLLPWVDRPARIRGTGAFPPILMGTILMALQAISMAWSLSNYGDAARINIVYALRGLWAVIFAWLFTRLPGADQQALSGRVLLLRMTGALLLTSSVAIALSNSGTQFSAPAISNSPADESHAAVLP